MGNEIAVYHYSAWFNNARGPVHHDGVLLLPVISNVESYFAARQAIANDLGIRVEVLNVNSFAYIGPASV
jgi:hypothetical protein